MSQPHPGQAQITHGDKKASLSSHDAELTRTRNTQ
jgi:hypothetical protein